MKSYCREHLVSINISVDGQVRNYKSWPTVENRPTARLRKDEDFDYKVSVKMGHRVNHAYVNLLARNITKCPSIQFVVVW